MAKYWSGNNRAPWHDYKQRQIYHITLMKRHGVMAFGSIAGDWRLPPGTYGRSYTQASTLGSIIKGCLRDISAIHPSLRIYQYALMPDHIHILLSVEAPLDDVVGHMIGAFKVLVNKRANIGMVFEKGFNDQILTTRRSLNVIYSYLRDNPYRLAVRQANPDHFSRINQIRIDGGLYQAYGNLHLLSHPFKEQVVIHRADDDVKRTTDRERWLHTGANGGTLVSSFNARCVCA